MMNITSVFLVEDILKNFKASALFKEMHTKFSKKSETRINSLTVKDKWAMYVT